MELLKMVFPYLIQTLVAVGTAFVWFRERLLKQDNKILMLEEKVNILEKSVERVKSDSKSEYKELKKQLDDLVKIFGSLETSVSNIDGYLHGRQEKAVQRALKKK